MKTFEVTFTLVLRDEAAHPRKWVPETIYEQLEHTLGEDVLSWNFAEVETVLGLA